MGRHRHPANIRRPRSQPAHPGPLPDRPEPIAPDETSTTGRLRRVAAAGALVGVLATVPAASSTSSDEGAKAVSVSDTIRLPVYTEPAPLVRLADMAASRAARDAEQAAAIQIQADAERAELDRRAVEERSRQEAQEAAEKADRQERAAVASQAAREAPEPPSRPTEIPPSAASVNLPGSAAQVAVETAMAQLGDPYVWGATGPSSFDCSGLVLYAYKAAGISLPRVSRDQARAGVAVTRAQLQPGDLVAFYSPVTHIGIYIGNGQMVHAPQPGESVEVIDIGVMPISAMRRVT